MKPGEQFAAEHGYDIYCVSGDRSSATYVKDGVFLTYYSDNTAQLEASVRMVMLKVGPFSLPNTNFVTFERQISLVFLAGQMTIGAPV